MQLYAQISTALADVLPALGQVLPFASDPTPEPEDVKAGWLAFGIFLALAVAVALLGWALTKQLRRTEANRQAGAFGTVEKPTDAGDAGDAGDEQASASDTAVRRDDEEPLP